MKDGQKTQIVSFIFLSPRREASLPKSLAQGQGFHCHALYNVEAMCFEVRSYFGTQSVGDLNESRNK